MSRSKQQRRRQRQTAQHRGSSSTVANARHRQVPGDALYERGLSINRRSIRAQRMALDASVGIDRLGKSHSGDRDYYTILGYPKELEFEDFFARYEREHIASRIVDFPADETWRDGADILDGLDKEASSETPFVGSVETLIERLRLFHYCQRADKLTGIGRFGILLIGVSGDESLETPIQRLSSPDDVLYLRPYSEFSVEIAELVSDASDPRCGLPAYYHIHSSVDMTGKQTVVQKVHWSRVIHIAEGLLENEVFGRPRLQRVFNLLDDILKIVGGSAEATWKLMRKGFVLNIASDANMTVEDEENLEEQFDEFDHGLRRYLQTRGMEVQDLGSEVVDPSGAFSLIIDLISGATGIPQRILLGSERGELASSQDAANWAGRIADRRTNWAEPVILRALLDRLIDWGALPPPRSGNYTVRWKPLFELTDLEKAQLANSWADAAEKMSNLSGQQAITLEEWRGEFTPFPSEAVQKLPPTAGHAMMEKQLEAQAEQIEQGVQDEEDDQDAQEAQDDEEKRPPDKQQGRRGKQPVSNRLRSVEVKALVDAAARVVAYG